MDIVMQEYEDALVTMQLAVAAEEVNARIERRMSKPNRVLTACINEVLKRITSDPVKRVMVGISFQRQPVAGLTKTVREYLEVKAKIERDGFVILKMRPEDVND
ncbi:hypothetical protein PQC34_gp013 [Cronobacter phage A24]|uniref:DUF7740 domain-containing protein n=1 Tax=Cronobacter phage A24 TaxID=2795745 RepID=A0A7T5QXZ9_9CAUD|nr:hypothetical protein PQC34_gp013 [Cronobacter phage A24]QQG33721.1 hypothetical protein [Cronobacter phage A24]